MKVMLIQPMLSGKKRISQPLGLGYLASCLEKTGHNVKIIDSLAMKYNITDVNKEFLRFDPDVVGITAMTQEIYNALAITKLAKENNPNCMTVLGGSHATVRSREILENNSYVDVIFSKRW